MRDKKKPASESESQKSSTYLITQNTVAEGSKGSQIFRTTGNIPNPTPGPEPFLPVKATTTTIYENDKNNGVQTGAKNFTWLAIRIEKLLRNDPLAPEEKFLEEIEEEAEVNRPTL